MAESVILPRYLSSYTLSFRKVDMEESIVKDALGRFGFEDPSPAITQSSTVADMKISAKPLALSVPRIFRKYLEVLKGGEVDSPVISLGRDVFLRSDGLLFVFLCAKEDGGDRDLSDAVKLPDISANTFQGKSDADSTATVCTRVLKSITLLRHLHRLQLYDGSSIPFLVDKLCTNYGWNDQTAMQFARDCRDLAALGSNMEPVMSGISTLRQPAVLKPLINYSADGTQILGALGPNVAYTCREAMARILFDRRSLHNGEAFVNLVCYLRRCVKNSDLYKLLLRSMELWGDPVIAKGHVTDEIVHYTKVCFIILYHLEPSTLSGKGQLALAERLSAGLPNHFNSTDPRTVVLAKFFFQLLTETIKYYENPEEEVCEELNHPEDEMCRLVLDSFHLCDKSEHFWYRPPPLQEFRQMDIGKEGPIMDDASGKNHVISDDEDDDDDSDLEPIDNLEADEQSKIKFLRNFLELFPEMDKYDDVSSALVVLPNIIRHQLALEHPDIGKELLDSVFFYENEFSSTKIEASRKECLGDVLKTHLDGNIQHFVQYFHSDKLQPWRKNLVLDVVYDTAKGASLAELQTIARCVFRQLLREERTLNDQDSIVRVPFLLFLGRVLCLLPEVMVEEEMVVKYLSALTNLRDVDGATEQTVKYSLNNVMNAIGHLQFSPSVRDGLRDTREWLAAIDVALG